MKITFFTNKYTTCQLNNSKDETIHHVRGITYRAMKEFIQFYRLKIEKI